MSGAPLRLRRPESTPSAVPPSRDTSACGCVQSRMTLLTAIGRCTSIACCSAKSDETACERLRFARLFRRCRARPWRRKFDARSSFVRTRACAARRLAKLSWVRRKEGRRDDLAPTARAMSIELSRSRAELRARLAPARCCGQWALGEEHFGRSSAECLIPPAGGHSASGWPGPGVRAASPPVSPPFLVDRTSRRATANSRRSGMQRPRGTDAPVGRARRPGCPCPPSRSLSLDLASAPCRTRNPSGHAFPPTAASPPCSALSSSSSSSSLRRRRRARRPRSISSACRTCRASRASRGQPRLQRRGCGPRRNLASSRSTSPRRSPITALRSSTPSSSVRTRRTAPRTRHGSDSSSPHYTSRSSRTATRRTRSTRPRSTLSRMSSAHTRLTARRTMRPAPLCTPTGSRSCGVRSRTSWTSTSRPCRTRRSVPRSRGCTRTTRAASARRSPSGRITPSPSPSLASACRPSGRTSTRAPRSSGARTCACSASRRSTGTRETPWWATSSGGTRPRRAPETRSPMRLRRVWRRTATETTWLTMGCMATRSSTMSRASSERCTRRHRAGSATWTATRTSSPRSSPPRRCPSPSTPSSSLTLYRTTLRRSPKTSALPASARATTRASSTSRTSSRPRSPRRDRSSWPASTACRTRLLASSACTA
ncbi:hypothetical protein DMC30DRAFT_255303 [Rhodotorula diobovata]|uniref:Uncharacterized protein n=1 Tax=Rhodotorula diobovata TaxID=5288 RepID=A0A5C5FUI9_9BASI|nr:hypothetical protein DMC30DRAFT_255303 [Rhodotorula diobovata]